MHPTGAKGYLAFKPPSSWMANTPQLTVANGELSRGRTPATACIDVNNHVEVIGCLLQSQTHRGQLSGSHRRHEDTPTRSRIICGTLDAEIKSTAFSMDGNGLALSPDHDFSAGHPTPTNLQHPRSYHRARHLPLSVRSPWRKSRPSQLSPGTSNPLITLVRQT